MRSAIPRSVGLAGLIACAILPTAKSAETAGVVPERTLVGLAKEADLAFLGTVVEFSVAGGRRQTDGSTLRRQVCIVRIKVMQPFVMEGRGVLTGVPQEIEAVGTVDQPVREFRRGCDHVFCLKWDEGLGAFCLPGAMLTTSEKGMEFRVPPDVLEAMLHDGDAAWILRPIRAEREKTSRVERLAGSLAYLVHFYRRMLESYELSDKLGAGAALLEGDEVGMIRGHEVLSEIRALLPRLAAEVVGNVCPGHAPSDARPPLKLLVEAGYVRECVALQEAIESVAERCKQPPDARALRDLASGFDGCGRWPEEVEERRERGRRAKPTASQPSGSRNSVE